MDDQQTVIDWNYSGPPEPWMGTGATRSERLLATSAGLLVPLILVYFAASGYVTWPWWEFLIAGLIGADVGAGAVANALNSCKRFYHSPVKNEESGLTALAQQPMFFAAFHIYPLLAGIIFGPWDLYYGFVWYMAMLASGLLILRAPLYLRRPAAVMLVCTAILINAYLLPCPRGFEWLVPLLFIKILLGHMVREEPYRPA